MVEVVFTAWFMTLNHLSREKWLHTNEAFNLINWRKSPRVEDKETRGKRNNRGRNQWQGEQNRQMIHQ